MTRFDSAPDRNCDSEPASDATNAGTSTETNPDRVSDPYRFQQIRVGPETLRNGLMLREALRENEARQAAEHDQVIEAAKSESAPIDRAPTTKAKSRSRPRAHWVFIVAVLALLVGVAGVVLFVPGGKPTSKTHPVQPPPQAPSVPVTSSTPTVASPPSPSQPTRPVIRLSPPLPPVSTPVASTAPSANAAPSASAAPSEPPPEPMKEDNDGGFIF